MKPWSLCFWGMTMPDISMCVNVECVKKKNCYRYMAKPDEIWQSYADFKPKNNSEENFECEDYSPLREEGESIGKPKK